MIRKIVLVSAVLTLALGALPAQASVNLVANGPAAHLTGFATPVVVVSKSEPLTYINGDPLFRHNVEATNTYGPDTNPWCGFYQLGRCPLFWSPLIGVGESTVVQGLSGAVSGTTYAFKCAPHPGSMTGVLLVVD